MNKGFKKIVSSILFFVFQMQGMPFGWSQNRLDTTSMQDQITAGPSFRTSSAPKGTGDRLDASQEIINRGAMMKDPSLVTLSYQVHVLGEVGVPGTYQVAASNRLSEALERAGGVLERGSLRFVQIRRKGEHTKVIDLLSFKLSGNLDANPYLLDNDVIYVPLRKSVAQIVGPVKRPDTYELRGEKDLESLIRLAGGFASGYSENAPIRVIRFENDEKRVIEMENRSEARRNFRIQNGDVVFIPHVLTMKNQFDYNLARIPGDNIFFPSYEERVFVLGAVYRPGPQSFSPYANLRQYLTLGGGTTRSAKIKKIRVLTQAGKTLKGKDDVAINPGDTIIVPERYLSPENWLSLGLGLVSSVLGITTTILVLAR